MGDRQEIHPNQRALVLTLAAAALETILCAWALLRIPSDSKNAFLFGLSKERLMMAAAFGLFFIANIVLIAFRSRFYEKILSKKAPFLILRIILLISFFFVLMPDYRFGKGAAYFTRLRPFLVWVFLTSLTLVLFCRFDRDRFAALRETFTNLAGNKKYIAAFLAFFLAGVLFVELTGLGKTVEKALWNKNGIPLQSIQLFSCLLAFVLLRRTGLAARIFSRKRILLFFVIWAVSAWIWSLVPLSDHFFAPGPYEPDLQFFPYSDAITYDIASQTALNGWGFNLGRIVLKPVLSYITFLAHLATGNDFNQGMLLQSAVFAVLPAVIFLFGDAVGGTGCGLLAAAFSLLKEWNALNTHTVLTIHSRLTMSEFLVQILLALFCFSIFRWLKKDGRGTFYAALAGGSLTLGMFTRYNFAAFLPAALVILAISYKKHLRDLCKPLLVFLLTAFLTAAPMLIRDSRTPGGMLAELQYTVRTVLIGRRFDLSGTGQNNKNAGSGAVSQNAADSGSASDLPEDQKEEFNTSQITQEFSNNNSNKNLPLFASMINHGMHNFITSALTLPMEITFQDLEHLYKNEGDGLWRDNWQGDFSAGQWVLIFIWILLSAAACGLLIKNHGTAGFSIFYFWLVYAFSIGFSRSSGGRYIVPCNWIPMLLLAWLCTILSNKGVFEPAAEEIRRASAGKTVFVMACFTAFFASMALFEMLIPARRTSLPEGDLPYLKEKLADHTEIDWDLVEQQHADGTLNITHGIVLYPRFYYYRVGEHGYTGSLGWKEYSRLAFQGINKEEDERLMQEYLLPHHELIEQFPQDSVFRAVSCKNENGYQDVLAVTIDTPDGESITYVRDPLPEFSCPVPEPVCIETDNCY